MIACCSTEKNVGKTVRVFPTFLLTLAISFLYTEQNSTEIHIEGSIYFK